MSSARRSVLVALLVAGAFFMENLDGTIIATALPKMAESFGANPIDLHIGITAYLLAIAIFIPTSGWAADRFGARTIFCTAIVVFTFASVLCGMSNALWQFAAARILQGIAGALMVPVGRLVVLRTSSKQDLMRAIAYITWPGLAAPIIGPPVGGFITTYATWHWIFFLNVPLGVIAVILAVILIPNSRLAEKKSFDWIGFVLSGAACASLMYGLDLVGREQIHWLVVGTLVGASCVLGALTVLHSRRVDHPLIDLSALRIPTFAVTIWGGSLFRIAIGAVPFLLPLLFQIGFGLDPFQSGILVLAVFAGNLCMKPATTPLLKRFGFRNVLIWNGSLAALSILACAILSPRMPEILTMVILFCGGLFRSMQFTSLNTIGFADVPPEEMSGATTFSSTVQQLTMGMGVAVGAVALRIAGLLRSSHDSTLTVIDFRLAFIFVGIIALLGVIDCFMLVPDAGAEVSGHRVRESLSRESVGP
jgi:EmrB/QacA subfamily drug resistance transporter